MLKQNQHLFRPFPNENPQTKFHDELSLNSICHCPPCQTKTEAIPQQLYFDKDLEQLKCKKTKGTSDFIFFLNEISKHSSMCLPHLPMLDTIVFNNDGSIKFVVIFEGGKLKISKLHTNLKTFMSQRKYECDLEYQKKKFQRQNMGFSFIQLDHQSQKYIKQFQNNIKFMNPLLNRVAITKSKTKLQPQILTQSEMNNLFVKITRKLFDFSNMEYIQVFPVMYGHEESSYVTKIKYFRQRETHKKNFKIAEHYVGHWYSKNETLENMQKEFLSMIKGNKQQTLMYYTYKLFIFFQKVSNKMVERALLHFITNDEGNSFFLKNIEYLDVLNLHEVSERVKELPKKLQNFDSKNAINLKKQMINHFDYFQRNFDRLQKEGQLLEEKRVKDAIFSNTIYQSLGNKLPESSKTHSFIKHMAEQQLRNEKIIKFNDQ